MITEELLEEPEVRLLTISSFSPKQMGLIEVD